MYLSIKPLDNVVSVNSWNYSSYMYAYEGQPNTLYFQLVRLDKNLNTIPMRYLSQAAALTVKMTFPAIKVSVPSIPDININVDITNQFTVQATQCFLDDKSIWKIALTSAQLPSSGAVQVAIIEDGIESDFVVKNAVSTERLKIGSC